MIVIDDVASADLPPVKQRTLADICREKFHTFGGFHEVYYEAPMYAGMAGVTNCDDA